MSTLIVSGLFYYLNMSKSKFIVLLSLLFLFSSCGKSKKEVQLAEEAELDSIMNIEPDVLELFEEEETSKAVDELFDDFFFNFAEDARFQNQRIRFPLRVKDEDAELQLNKDEWHKYNRFSQQEFYSVIYERDADLALQKDTTVHEVSVQWIYLQDGYVECYNFKRIPQGKWVLFNIEKQDVASTPNGDFVNFYSEFIADSAYQRSCIVEPIAYHMDDNGEGEEVNSEISADEWFEMKEDMPFPKDVLVNINYGQSCTEGTSKNVLMEGVSNGLFMNFKFEKHEGEWKLTKIDI